MDLDLQSLEEAIIKLSTMTDDRGVLIRQDPKKIVVALSEYEMAKKIMAEATIESHEIEVDLSGDIES